MTIAALTLVSALLAYLRVRGEKSHPFQVGAHLFWGLLTGLALGLFKHVDQEAMWPAILAAALAFVECFAFARDFRRGTSTTSQPAIGVVLAALATVAYLTWAAYISQQGDG